MQRLASYSGKLFKAGLAALIVLALLLPLSLNLSASGPEDSWQIAPINPAFLRYMQQQKLQSFQGVEVSSLAEKNYGYVPPMIDLSHLTGDNQFQNYTAATALPTSYDWRSNQKVTPVKNQGTSGTCWAFGTLASLESRISIVDNQQYDLSELNLAAGVDPSWVNYHLNRSETGGDSFIATNTLAKIGTRDESVQPYGNPNQAYATVNNAVADTTSPPLQKVTDFRIVAATGISEADIIKIKQAIYTYGPVSAAFRWEDGKLSSKNVYDYPNCNKDANHMISIIGWSDSLAHPSDGGKGAWIVKNSWGSSWGNAGYFYLCYGAANLQEIGSYHGTDNAPGYKNYLPGERLYYWDEAGYLLNLGFDNNPTANIRSVFTASSQGTLTTVTFWTTGGDAQYQINIRDSTDTLLGTQSGVCQESGYYSIPLTSAISLSASQQFKVDVTMTTPGYNYPVAASGKISGYYEPPIQTEQCFVYLNNGWIDAASINATHSENGNIYPVQGLNFCLGAKLVEDLVTGDADHINPDSAVLHGFLRSLGGAASVNLSFDYGISSDALNSTTSSVSLASPGPFSLPVYNLSSHTTHYFRAKAVGNPPFYGATQHFTTLYVPPAVISSPATSIMADTAIFNGNLTDKGEASTVTLSFEYGADQTIESLWSGIRSQTTTGEFSIPVNELVPDTTYRFRATTQGDYAQAPFILGNYVLFTTLPAVSNLTATAISNKQINLAWNENNSNEAGFKIERKKHTDPETGFKPIATLKANITYYENKSGLTSDTTYDYRVRAYYTVGNSAYSTIASAPTLPNPPSAPILIDPKNGAAITGLTTILTWNAPAKGQAVGYNVQVSLSSKFETSLINEFSLAQTNYTIGEGILAWGGKYYWRIAALDNYGGRSAWSSSRNFKTAACAPPAAPINLEAEPTGSKQVKLSWTANSLDESGFYIERKKSTETNFKQIGKTAAGVTGYLDKSGLIVNTSYDYRIRAYNAGGTSDYSGTDSATTWPAPPKAPKLFSPASAAKTVDLTPWLTWQTPTPGVDEKYEVQIALSSAFKEPLVDQAENISTTVFQIENGKLTWNTKYYWRVRATDSHGQTSSWSSSRYFKTPEEP